MSAEKRHTSVGQGALLEVAADLEGVLFLLEDDPSFKEICRAVVFKLREEANRDGEVFIGKPHQWALANSNSGQERCENCWLWRTKTNEKSACKPLERKPCHD